MGHTLGADGFAVPPTPSTRSRSYLAHADAGSVAPLDLTDATPNSGRSSRRLAEEPLYRSMNLAASNIYLRDPSKEFPEYIANFVHDVSKDRGSPGPSPSQLRHNANLYELENGAGEPQVEQHFRTNIFPYPDITESLQRSDKQPMTKHTVPKTGSKLKVSNPAPDMLYGYRRNAVLQQQAQLISMGTEMVANNEDLIYPFFVIEFNGDGPTGVGSMWVAANQCLGGSASCVNIAERLNHQLKKCKSEKIQPIDGAIFSIAMNGTEARLYISWKHNELGYYMRKIDSFLLQKPRDYLEFRKYVRNIIDWGKDTRLKEIRESLDNLRRCHINSGRPTSMATCMPAAQRGQDGSIELIGALQAIMFPTPNLLRDVYALSCLGCCWRGSPLSYSPAPFINPFSTVFTANRGARPPPSRLTRENLIRFQPLFPGCPSASFHSIFCHGREACAKHGHRLELTVALQAPAARGRQRLRPRHPAGYDKRGTSRSVLGRRPAGCEWRLAIWTFLGLPCREGAGVPQSQGRMICLCGHVILRDVDGRLSSRQLCASRLRHVFHSMCPLTKLCIWQDGDVW